MSDSHSDRRSVSRWQLAAMRPSVLARVQRAVAPYMRPGERVEQAFYGQTGMPTGYAFLGALIGRVKFVVVIATHQNIYVFLRGILQSPRIKGMLTKYAIEPGIDVSFGKGALKVGGDTYWVAALVAQDEARALAGYVDSVRSEQRPP